MEAHTRSKSKSSLTIREMVIFALLGALMFASKWITEILPNIHLLGVCVIRKLVQIFDNEYADHRDQHHRDVVRIPKISYKGMGGIYNKFELYGAGDRVYQRPASAGI